MGTAALRLNTDPGDETESCSLIAENLKTLKPYLRNREKLLRVWLYITKMYISVNIGKMCRYENQNYQK